MAKIKLTKSAIDATQPEARVPHKSRRVPHASGQYGEHLLRDCPAGSGGTSTAIGKLWVKVLSGKPQSAHQRRPHYTRQAFELGIQAACDLKKIEMRYTTDHKAHQAQDLLDKLKSWTATGSMKRGSGTGDCRSGKLP